MPIYEATLQDGAVFEFFASSDEMAETILLQPHHDLPWDTMTEGDAVSALKVTAETGEDLQPQDFAQMVSMATLLATRSTTAAAASGGFVEAVRQVFQGEEIDAGRIGLRTAEPIGGGIIATGGAQVNRFLKMLGGRITQSILKNDPKFLARVARVFGVEEHKSLQFMGRYLNERRLAGRSDPAIQRTQAAVRRGADVRQGQLDTASRGGAVIDQNAAAAHANRLIDQSDVANVANSQSGLSTARGAIEDFRMNPGLNPAGQGARAGTIPVITRVPGQVTQRSGGQVTTPGRQPSTVTTQRPFNRPLTIAEAERIKEATAQAPKMGDAAQNASFEGQQAATAGVRRELEQAVPGLKATNQKLSEDMLVRDALIATRKHAEGQAPISIPEFAGVGTFALAGDPTLAAVASLGRPSVAGHIGQNMASLGGGIANATNAPLMTSAIQNLPGEDAREDLIRRFLDHAFQDFGFDAAMQGR